MESPSGIDSKYNMSAWAEQPLDSDEADKLIRTNWVPKFVFTTAAQSGTHLSKFIDRVIYGNS